MKNDHQIIKKVSQNQHGINRSQLSSLVLSVIATLQKQGFEAYLVGGGVRDLLLKKIPKDFDVATSAKPEQVHQLFRKSRIIGRRFRLTQVFSRHETVEVSTFRARLEQPSSYRLYTGEGVIVRDNAYGSLKEDAYRRDFTINALYFDPQADVVLDMVDGLKDIKSGLVRTVGEPNGRIQEDPIRLLRALRFSAKLEFQLCSKLKNVLRESHHLLAYIPPSRVYDAFCQVFFSGFAEKMYHQLCHYDYFSCFFPRTDGAIEAMPKGEVYRQLLIHALCATDQRYYLKQTLNPGFLIAIMLWPVLQQELGAAQKLKSRFSSALYTAIHQSLAHQKASFMGLSSRVMLMVREIWMLQYYFTQKKPNKVARLLEHRYFRAAHDFLIMRARFDSSLAKLTCDWNKLRALHLKPSKRCHRRKRVGD